MIALACLLLVHVQGPAPYAVHGGGPYRGPEGVVPPGFAAQQAPQVTLPPSPSADLLKSPVDPAADFAMLPQPLWSDPAWNQAAPWDAWAAALAEADQPTARATLALIARSQGRYDAMWEHIGALPPAWAQPLIQALHTPQLAPDARPLLAPPLPPLPAHDPESNTLPPKRLTEVHNINVGETRFDMFVEDTPEGVEVTLTWRAGPPLEVDVELPIPLTRAPRIMYSDWNKIELSDRYTVTVAPRLDQDDQTWVLWARCRPVWIAVPRLGAGQAAVNMPPIELTTTSADDQLGRLEGFAGFLKAALGIQASVLVDPGPFPDPRDNPGMGRTPLRIDLAPNDERRAKWLTIAEQIERVALQSQTPAAGR